MLDPLIPPVAVRAWLPFAWQVLACSFQLLCFGRVRTLYPRVWSCACPCTTIRRSPRILRSVYSITCPPKDFDFRAISCAVGAGYFRQPNRCEKMIADEPKGCVSAPTWPCLLHGHRHQVAVEVGDDPDRAGNDEKDDQHTEGEGENKIGAVEAAAQMQEEDEVDADLR